MQTQRTALITGASGGLGRAISAQLAHAGFRVFGTSRNPTDDDRAGVAMVPLDVTDPESIHHCVETIRKRAGPIDLLVNNAGIMHEGFAEETNVADARHVLDVNLLGPFQMANAVLPDMRTRRTGQIINIGSLAAWVGEPGEALYAASKAGLARYTESLRHEVWHLGISVSLIEPGAFTTNVLHASGTNTASIPDYDGPREHAQQTLHASLERGADPRQVAARVLALTRSPHPRFRYGAGADGRWVPHLRTMIPSRVFDYLLRRSFKLTTAPPDRR